MDQGNLAAFGNTAKSLSRNPLGIIAPFIVLVYGLACLVVIGSSLAPNERLPIIYFLVVFPFIVLGVFTYLVAFRAGQLFAPGDFRREETYLELQRMRISAAASLTASNITKDQQRSGADLVHLDDLVKSVEDAVRLRGKSIGNPNVLWVDDNPDNNVYERKAMEAVGIRFVLATRTNEALDLMSRQRFSAVISDMGRQEGPREGYKLLDFMRASGNRTPLFFYASSNAPEHKRETIEHGGQGCTNDGQELFDMVTRTVFSANSADRTS